MFENKTCQELCKTTIPKDDARFINDRIREKYKHDWAADSLPVAQALVDGKTKTTYYQSGFGLGQMIIGSENPDVKYFLFFFLSNFLYNFISKINYPFKDIFI